MNVITIIVPFYKGNQYMPRMISAVNKSVSKLQTVYNDVAVELIVVNDSPDIDVLLTNNCDVTRVKIIRHV